jgi:hypothetical protein
MTALVVLSFLILLPIVPAYLLFKALPSNAQVNGPWQGLQIKLGGAFAGYCFVLIILLHFHNLWSPYEVWELHGVVVDENGLPLEKMDPNTVVTRPPIVQAPGSGKFSIMFNTSTGIGGEMQYPTVVISAPGYHEEPISLDPKDPPLGIQLQRDFSTNTITASKITLRKLPAYQLGSAATLNDIQAAHPGGRQ